MKHFIKSLISIMAAGIFCLPLSACAGKSTTREFFAMDTYMYITAYGRDCEAALEAAETEIHRLEAELSATRESSAVAALNRAGRLPASGELPALLTAALSLSQDTDGAFDVTIRPVLTAWGFTTGAYRVPAAEERETLLALVDWRQVSVTAEEIALGAGQQIDLGGIAKGYAARRAAQVLDDYGVRSALIYLGGSVLVTGSKPKGVSWRTGIQNPDGSENYLGVLTGQETAIVTSGAYQRCFEADGVRYHHIIDPATGAPAESGLASVTIVCGDAVRADGYSTALYVMGAARAEEFWRSHSGEFDMVLYTDAGELRITPGLAECFSSELPYEVLAP